jgi:hypothetical protein
MSDMNTARRAGGGGRPFTLAVVCAFAVVAALFAWRWLCTQRLRHFAIRIEKLMR